MRDLTDHLVDIITDLETVDWGIPDSLPNVRARLPDLTVEIPRSSLQIMAVVPAAQVLQTDLKQTVDASS